MVEKAYEVRRLSSKIKMLWFAQYLVTGLIVWLVLSLVLAYVNLPFFSSMSQNSRSIMVLGLVVVCLLPVFAWLELKYRNFTFTLTDTEILIRYGVISKKRIDIPFSTIENVSVSKPLIDRLMGVGTIMIDTAGGAEKEGVLPGIDAPDSVLNEILERMKNVAGAGEKDREEKTISLLEEIRDELRDLKAVLGGALGGGVGAGSRTVKKPKDEDTVHGVSGEPIADIFKRKKK